jgi:hypothetical protein
MNNTPTHPPPPYILNVEMYSFCELLQLFKLPSNVKDITEEEMKKAKWMVLKTHPDKSRQPPDLFLFFKRAFQIIVEVYNEYQKTNQEIPQTKMEYFTDNLENKEIKSGVQTRLDNFTTENFQQTFNELFDKHQMGKTIVNKNEWFSKDDGNTTHYHQKIHNISEMNATIEKIKEKQKQTNEMVIHNEGVKELSLSNIHCNNLYDDIDDGDASQTTYIETDPFSRLKFEDIKKVHKNETVFAIGEDDYMKIPKYANVEQYMVSRDAEPLTSPLNERENLMLLEKQQAEKERLILLKYYESNKKRVVNEQKNKSVLSYFLQIGE